MKKFFAGMLTMLLLVSLAVTASAATGKVTKELEYRNISVTLDGILLDLRNVKGEAVEPFMFEGTNYLPVRALAECLGLNVAWDGKNATVVLTTPEASAVSIKEGMYLVGKDIPAGTYLLTATNKDRDGYYERLSDASSEMDSIIANGRVENTAYLDVKAGEYLRISRCTGVLQ